MHMHMHMHMHMRLHMHMHMHMHVLVHVALQTAMSNSAQPLITRYIVRHIGERGACAPSVAVNPTHR